MNELDQHRYFFDSGIRFQCQRCGACCTGAPGVIRVSDEEAMAIADFLDQPVQEAIDALLYPWENGYSIREDDDGRCLFYDEGCRIYPVRPRQCRTFPFWTAILRSQDRWDSVRRSCRGVGKGRLFAKHEILDILNS